MIASGPPADAIERKEEGFSASERDALWRNPVRTTTRRLCRVCAVFLPPEAHVDVSGPDDCGTFWCPQSMHEDALVGVFNSGCVMAYAELHQGSHPDSVQLTMIHYRCDGYRRREGGMVPARSVAAWLSARDHAGPEAAREPRDALDPMEAQAPGPAAERRAGRDGSQPRVARGHDLTEPEPRAHRRGPRPARG